MKPKEKSASSGFTRRDMLMLLGQAVGGLAMHQAMTSIGLAAESTYTKPLHLEGSPKGKGNNVLILGAGIAGMVAAYELRKAGYKVTLLEYREKAGGRCWTLRGGDSFTELGGFTQKCNFAKNDYVNPGPWRIPYNHYALLDYCKELNIALEPFFHDNHNAYLHSTKAFNGKPQRFGQVFFDMQGHMAELLAKAAMQDKLDIAFTAADKEVFLEAMQSWGALDDKYSYAKNLISSHRRGYAIPPGGGLQPGPVPSDIFNLRELIESRLWSFVPELQYYEYQASIFQPVGGMDMIAQAFAKEVGSLIRFNTKVTKIAQSEKNVTVTCTDLKTKKVSEVKADWCICTIPLSILSQMDIQVSKPMRDAINAVPYDASFKAGVQFKRRFWEEDERIYGGVTYTNLPLHLVSYPMHNINKKGKGVLLAAYAFGEDAYKFTSLTPEKRLKEVVKQLGNIHPQAAAEFDNGISVGWHRVPWTNGCYGLWSAQTREDHYKNLCQLDGRIMLAGEHASHLPAWIEGACLSAIDTVERLHQQVVNQQASKK